MIRRSFLQAFTFFIPFIFSKPVGSKSTMVCIGWIVEQRMAWNNGHLRMIYQFFSIDSGPVEHREEGFIRDFTEKMQFADSHREVTATYYPVYKTKCFGAKEQKS